MQSDTISAIATPVGEGAIGMVRLSGERAFAIAEQMFQRAKPEPIQSHRIYYGTLVEPHTGEVLDRALMFPYRAPHSYTGEDVVEFTCHGSPYLLNRVLTLTWRLGARPAEPGEFTQRAFLNGKLDMAQAESVADLIRARTEAQHRTAIALHEGALSRAIRQLSKRLIGVLAQVEAVIDFSEEIGELDTGTLSQSLESIQAEIEQILSTAQAGRLVREGVRTAIVGRPNVGKSSLLNRLLGEERAIVTPIPGTTRDTLEETARIGGVPFVIIDTAGLRQSDDLVEQIGIERTRRAVQSADLILVVLDASEGLTDADRAIFAQLPPDRPTVVVWNKVDLTSPPVPPSPHAERGVSSSANSPSPFTERGSGGEVNIAQEQGDEVSHSAHPSKPQPSSPPSPFTERGLGGEVSYSALSPQQGSGGEVNRTLGLGGEVYPTQKLTTCFLSALTGEGMDNLHQAMLQAVHLHQLHTESLLLTHERHAEALRRALSALQSVQASLKHALLPDLIAVDLRSAWLALGEITGETLDAELVNRIFRDFCIGK